MKKTDSGASQREYFERLKEGCRAQAPMIYQSLLKQLNVEHLAEVAAAERERLAHGVPILIFALFLGTQTDEVLASLAGEVPAGLEPFPPHLSRLRITPKGRSMASVAIAARWDQMATVAHAAWTLRTEGPTASPATIDPVTEVIPHLLRHTECVEVKAVTKRQWFQWFDRWPGLGFLLARRSLQGVRPEAGQELLELGAQPKSRITFAKIRALCEKNWTPIKSGMVRLAAAGIAKPMMKPAKAKAPRKAPEDATPMRLRRRSNDLSVMQSPEPKLKSVGSWKNYASKSDAHAKTGSNAKIMGAIKAQLGRPSGPSFLGGSLLS